MGPGSGQAGTPQGGDGREQGLEGWAFARGSSEQSCMEIGTLTKAFNEGDHNEEDVKKRKSSGTEVSKLFL